MSYRKKKSSSSNQPGPASGADLRYIPQLARAVVAAGADAVFMEVHPDPDNAKCDGPNSLPLDEFGSLLVQLSKIKKAVGG